MMAVQIFLWEVALKIVAPLGARLQYGAGREARKWQGVMGKLGTQLSSRCNPSDYTHRRIAIQIIEVWSWFCNIDTLYSSSWPCLISSSVCHDLNTSMSGALSSRDGSLWAGETCTWPWGACTKSASGCSAVVLGVPVLFSRKWGRFG